MKPSNSIPSLKETNRIRSIDETDADLLRSRILQLEERVDALKAEIRASGAKLASLSRAEAFARTLLEKSADGIIMLNADGRVVFANPAAESLFDIPRDRLVGEPFGFPVVSGESADIELIALGGGLRQVEIRQVKAQWEGEPCCIASLRDVSEQVRMEREIREKEHYYRSLINHLREDIIVIDPNRRIVDINNSFLTTTGQHRDQVIGRPCHDILHNRCVPCGSAECGLERVFETGQAVQQLHRHRRKDGSETWIDLVLSPLFDAGGQVTHVIETARDVSDITQAHQEINQHSRFLQNLIDTAPSPIFYKDRQGRYLGCNAAFETAMGVTRENILGKTVFDIFSREEAVIFASLDDDLYSNEGVQSFEKALRFSDGKMHTVIINKAVFRDSQGGAAGLVGVIADITERKRLEEERKEMEYHMRMAQKLEAIGTMASGIAHDFNNILSAIFGYAELAQDGLQRGADLEADLREILNAGNRARELVQQILTFSHQTDEELKTVNIIPLVKETLKFVRAATSATIDIQWRMPETPILVRSSPTQIHQIVMNLCTNAVYAMARTGGTLEVTLTRTPLGHEAEKPDDALKPGDYAELRVSDTGHGIPPEIMNRIFDPYFTTKPPGEGTGLGLSVVHGAVRNHCGAITVQSQPGSGTIFTVYLPIVEKEEDVNEIVRKQPMSLEGEGRILCVDDEETLVRLAHRMLEKLGYQPVTAISSRVALELFKAAPHVFDLLITGLRMPYMDGAQLAAEIKKIRPDIPILLLSGHLNKEVLDNLHHMGFTRVIAKPIQKQELAEAVHEALSGGKNGEK